MLEFTWQSFVFMVLNFLILAAILYKLLHKPLLNVLAERQKKIEDAHRAAEQKAESAGRTQHEYEGRLAAIEEERDKLLADAREKAEQARGELIERARGEAEREVANLKRDWGRQRRDALDTLQDEIVETSLDLARRALAQLADQDIESRLQTRLQRELESLASSADKQTVRSLFSAEGPVRVVSAAPLAEEDRRGISDLIQALSEDRVDVSFDTDPDLIAGTRIEFSSQAIDASLADVVNAARERFAELAPEPRENDAS